MISESLYKYINNNIDIIEAQDTIIDSYLTSCSFYLNEFTSQTSKSTPHSLKNELEFIKNTIKNDNPSNSSDGRGINPLVSALNKLEPETFDYYVSEDGDDNNPGTFELPWKTIEKAHNTASFGDTIGFREGTYQINTQSYFVFTKSGLTYKACDKEIVKWQSGILTDKWIQDSAYTWHVDLSSSEFSYLTIGSVAAIIKDGWPTINISGIATITAGVPAPSGLIGAFTSDPTCTGRYMMSFDGYQTSHNGKQIYTKRLNPTCDKDFCLFWDGNFWRISDTIDDAGLNYWYLNIVGAPDPAGSYTGVGTCVGVPIVSYVDTYPGLPNDFTSPPSGASDEEFWNGGNLIYDLTYYDCLNKVLYLRSNEINPITDPTTQIFLVSAVSQHICINDNVNDIIFDGLHIEYGWSGYHLYGESERLTIKNCYIKHFYTGGIFGNPVNSIIENNYIDYISDELWFFNSTSSWRRLWHFHCVYIGYLCNNCIWRNNFIGRSRSGWAFHTWTSANNLSFYNNVCLGASQGSLITIGDNLTFTNNVILEIQSLIQGVHAIPTMTVGCYVGDGEQTFTHNYIEAFAPIYGYPPVNANVYTDNFNNNVIVTSSSTSTYKFINYQNVTAVPAINDMNNNIFIGNGNHGAHINPDLDTDDYTTMLTYFSSKDWNNNTYENSSEALDPLTVQTFLDSNPTLTMVLDYFRTYALSRSTNVSGIREI